MCSERIQIKIRMNMSRTVSSQSCGMQQVSEVFTFVQERAVRYQAHGINKDHGDVNARITASSVTALSGLRWFNLADYSSIHPLIETSYPSGSWREVGASPGWLQARDRVHLGQAANPIHHRPKSAPFFFFPEIWLQPHPLQTSATLFNFHFDQWSFLVVDSNFRFLTVSLMPFLLLSRRNYQSIKKISKLWRTIEHFLDGFWRTKVWFSKIYKCGLNSGRQLLSDIDITHCCHISCSFRPVPTLSSSPTFLILINFPLNREEAWEDPNPSRIYMRKQREEK